MVATSHTHFQCVPDGDFATWTADAIQACHPESTSPSRLTLHALSVSPRIFLIEELLSPAEVAHLIDIGSPNVERSMTGQADAAFQSETRTSKNTWCGGSGVVERVQACCTSSSLPFFTSTRRVRRNTSPITETIFQRAADLLGLPDAMLDDSTNAELLQLVHYEPGDKYDAHHDWGVENGAASRYITLLMYLR